MKPTHICAATAMLLCIACTPSDEKWKARGCPTYFDEADGLRKVGDGYLILDGAAHVMNGGRGDRRARPYVVTFLCKGKELE